MARPSPAPMRQGVTIFVTRNPENEKATANRGFF
jgi:hypothetical protein